MRQEAVAVTKPGLKGSGICQRNWRRSATFSGPSLILLLELIYNAYNEQKRTHHTYLTNYYSSIIKPIKID